MRFAFGQQLRRGGDRRSVYTDDLAVAVDLVILPAAALECLLGRKDSIGLRAAGVDLIWLAAVKGEAFASGMRGWKIRI